MNLSSIMDADATIDEETPDLQHRVYYLPLGLSTTQRDLAEVLIALHRPSLLTQLRGDDSLLKNEREDHGPFMSDPELESSLATNLTAIANHPYLLVEHYMPKRLLLMESHERLMAASDKFEKFDKLLGAIHDLSIDVLVVGHNVKELDIIEAFLLGRSLSYKRYSGTPLDEPTKKTDESSDKKSTSKDDDYAPKVKPTKVPEQVRLHLITSQQLTATPFTAAQPQFIVSFDALLDETNANLQYIRLAHTAGVPVPLIKLLVVQSHLHGLLSNSDITLDSSRINQRALFSSLVKRNTDYTKSFDAEYGVLFQNVRKYFVDPLNVKWPVDHMPEFRHFTTEEVLDAVQKDYTLLDHDSTTKKIKRERVAVPSSMPLAEYKSLLAKLAIERIGILQDVIESNREKLKPLRVRSTLKHAADDSLKLSIGATFKESLDLKERATSAEKRFERLESDYEKLKDTASQLEKKRDSLKLIESGQALCEDNELDKEIVELEDVYEKLELELTKMSQASDRLRQEYQLATSTAAEKSLRTKSIKDQDTQLAAKSGNIGHNHRKSLLVKKQLASKQEVEKMRLELNFLQQYNGRLLSTVKERGATLNVGRNGRVHRSTTPYV